MKWIELESQGNGKFKLRLESVTGYSEDNDGNTRIYGNGWSFMAKIPYGEFDAMMVSIQEDSLPDNLKEVHVDVISGTSLGNGCVEIEVANLMRNLPTSPNEFRSMKFLTDEPDKYPMGKNLVLLVKIQHELL